MGCTRSGEEEYRELIKDFVTWCDSIHPLLNTAKTTRTNTWVFSWMMSWTGLPTQRLHAGMDRAVCTSLGDWHPSTSAGGFYQSVVASAFMYTVVCWGGRSLKKRDIACLDKLVRKAGSVVGAELDNQTSVTMNWLLSIIDNPNHSLHSATSRQRSSFSDRLLSLSCSTNRLRKLLLPHTIQLCTPHGEIDKRCATYTLDWAL